MPYGNNHEWCMELQAENNRLRDELEWQPIETAPKDAVNILAVDARTCYEPMVVQWDKYENSDYSWLGSEGYKYHKDVFTHWMPLPEPPTGEE